MESKTLLVLVQLMVCRLVAGQCHLAHHGPDKFVSLLDLVPQSLAKHDLEQIRREIWLD